MLPRTTSVSLSVLLGEALEQANDFAGTRGVVIVGRLLQLSSSDSFPMFTVIWATRCILQAMRGDCALGIHGIGLLHPVVQNHP